MLLARLPQANPRASAVFVDELDAGRLQTLPEHTQRRCCLPSGRRIGFVWQKIHVHFLFEFGGDRRSFRSAAFSRDRVTDRLLAQPAQLPLLGFLARLPQPTQASAVFVDEFDAGGLPALLLSLSRGSDWLRFAKGSSTLPRESGCGPAALRSGAMVIPVGRQQ